MIDKDVERVAFAWTPGHGAYKHYPPYVNITGNRIAVRGPELCNNGCYEPGPYAAIELSPEAFVELRAAIAKVDAECRNCLGEQWVCENHLDMAWPTICECGAGAPCPICRPDMANAAYESAVGERVGELEAEVGRLTDALKEIDGLQGEINPSNYDHDDACELNAQFCYAQTIARAALTSTDVVTDAAKLGTVSLTSFDGHCVRIDFPNREDAERMYAVLTEQESK
jgi:hypothetical protein